jgi:hypothetical protein
MDGIEEVEEPEPLSGLYKIIMGTFGIGMAGMLILGFGLAIHWVDKHDRKVQTAAKIRQVTHKPFKDPLLAAQTVKFEIPYLHGGDPQSQHLMAEWSKAKTGSVSGGFKIPATYVTPNTQVQTELTLSCQTLCQLSFELPANRVLLPWFNNKKVHYPEREFKLESFGFRLEVAESRLQGIGVEERPLAPFDLSLNLKKHYKETYLGSDGKVIRF